MNAIKLNAWIAVSALTVCLGCVPAGEPLKTEAQTHPQIPKEQELLWSVSENGKYAARIDRYDSVERIAHVSRPQPPYADPIAKQSRLAHEFANGASLPYQYDGTNWIPLWSPALPPDLQSKKHDDTQH